MRAATSKEGNSDEHTSSCAAICHRRATPSKRSSSSSSLLVFSVYLMRFRARSDVRISGGCASSCNSFRFASRTLLGCSHLRSLTPFGWMMGPCCLHTWHAGQVPFLHGPFPSPPPSQSVGMGTRPSGCEQFSIRQSGGLVVMPPCVRARYARSALIRFDPGVAQSLHFSSLSLAVPLI